jgi:hypothetical protein
VIVAPLVIPISFISLYQNETLQLRLAFVEAKRSEEFLRLHRSAQQIQQQQLKGPQSPQEEADTTPTQPGGHKRTRRRRRQRKSRVTGGDESPLHVAAKPPPSKKQHDAPMTKRDIYFCLRCGVVSVGKQGTDVAVGRVTLLNWENQGELRRERMPV